MKKILEDLIFKGRYDESKNVFGKKWTLKALDSNEQEEVNEAIKKYDNASKTQAAKIEILARSILTYENIELNNKSENRELIGKLPSVIVDEMYKKQLQLQNDVNDSFSTMDEDLKN